MNPASLSLKVADWLYGLNAPPSPQQTHVELDLVVFRWTEVSGESLWTMPTKTLVVFPFHCRHQVNRLSDFFSQCESITTRAVQQSRPEITAKPIINSPGSGCHPWRRKYTHKKGKKKIF